MIEKYDIDKFGCIGYLCPYRDSCNIEMSEPPQECFTHYEIEETAKMIIKSISSRLNDEYGIDINHDDYNNILQMVKRYVLHENLKRDDIVNIEHEIFV